ncbi:MULTISPECIES: hypothetical protein [Chroococcidiopsis]|nr:MULTISPECIES: hypothetical protein [Chroococcidiopsis]
MLVSYQREALGGIKGAGTSWEQGAGERELRERSGAEGAEGEN